MPVPRIQRAMMDWLAANRPRLAYRPVIVRRTRDNMELRLEGVTSTISVVLRRNGLDVLVEHEGEVVDMLLSLDATPGRRQGKVICLDCLHDHGSSNEWSNREGLWSDHLLDPLADWIKGDLAEADRLAVHDLHGMTWGKLLRPGDEDGEAGLVTTVEVRA